MTHQFFHRRKIIHQYFRSVLLSLSNHYKDKKKGKNPHKNHVRCTSVYHMSIYVHKMQYHKGKENDVIYMNQFFIIINDKINN